MVVTRDHRNPYLDALEAADHGDLSKLIKLFAKLQTNQALKAIATAENVMTTADDVSSLLDGLTRPLNTPSAQAEADYDRVIEHSVILEKDVCEQLNFIKPKLAQFMINRGIDVCSTAMVDDSRHELWLFSRKIASVNDRDPESCPQEPAAPTSFWEPILASEPCGKLSSKA